MTVHAPVVAVPNLVRLRQFISDLADVIDEGEDEAAVLAAGEVLLKRLVAVDDWLPDTYAQPHPDHYQQYLLHCDSRERFSVVSFVWGPGQTTPIHNHTVWGLVGILRGAERVESFHGDAQAGLTLGGDAILQRGEVDAVSPDIGDIHRVSNGADGVSVSIHVYGANIGAVRRSVFRPDGTTTTFISGYANPTLPNLWTTTQP